MPDVGHVERRPVDDLQVRVGGDGLDVLGLDEVVALDVTGLERLETRGVVGDRPEDDGVEQGRLAPVVIVADDRQAVAAGPGLELERARPDRVLRSERALRLEDAVGVHGAGVGLELGQGGRAGDCERRLRQSRDERRRRLRQVDDGRGLVRGLTARVEALGGGVRIVLRGEAAEDDLPVVGRARVLERTLEVVPAVEVEADRLGVERLAVVERHALTERECPLGAVLVRLPALSKTRHGLGAARLERDERLEDLLNDAERLAVGDERAVERDRVRSARKDERAARRGVTLLFRVRRLCPKARPRRHRRRNPQDLARAAT